MVERGDCELLLRTVGKLRVCGLKVKLVGIYSKKELVLGVLTKRKGCGCTDEQNWDRICTAEKNRRQWGDACAVERLDVVMVDATFKDEE